MRYARLALVTSLLVGCAEPSLDDGGDTSADATTFPSAVGCFDATPVWTNVALGSRSARFTVRFAATPGASGVDATMGLAAAPADRWTAMAAIVRFSITGAIDARSGGSYVASQHIPYVPNQAHVFELNVDPQAHTYDAYVTLPGGAKRTIGLGLAFRTEQAAASTLAYLAMNATGGTNRVCDITIPGPSTSCARTFPAAARTRYVATTGNDSSGDGSTNRPFASIARAFEDAQPGDDIIVRPGTYTTTRSELLYTTKSGTPDRWITLRAATPGTVILDGRNHATVQGLSLEGSYIQIVGFEFRGFQHHGVSLWRRSNLRVLDSYFHDIGRICTDVTYGRTGIYTFEASDVLIEGNRFERIGRLAPGENGCTPGNQYWQNHDHGIYVDASPRMTVRNNWFGPHPRGWAIQVYSGGGGASPGLAIANNTFVGANPDRDGQIVLDSIADGVSVRNNIFAQPRGAAIYVTSSAVRGTVARNLTTAAAMISGTSANIVQSESRLSTDPLFVGASAGNYRLQAGSPAVDRSLDGHGGRDLEGTCRPVSGGPDLGAFEHH